MQLYRFLLVAGISAMVGCAAPAALTGEMAAADAALRDARDAGAQEDFGASMYFGLAERELEAAKRRASVGDHASARGLAMRAQADAEVAATIMHEASAREAARRTSEDADKLATLLDTPIQTPIVMVPEGVLAPPPSEVAASEAATASGKKSARAGKKGKGASAPAKTLAPKGAPGAAAVAARKEPAR